MSKWNEIIFIYLDILLPSYACKVYDKNKTHCRKDVLEEKDEDVIR